MPTSVTQENQQESDQQSVPGTTAPLEVGEKMGAKEFPVELQNALKELYKQFASRDRWIRRWEVQKVRKNRFFWRGMQRFIWNAQAEEMVPAPYAGGINASGTEAADRPQYLDTTNIYQGYGRMIIAALTQNTPSVRPEPKNPQDPIHISGASGAEKMRKVIERNNNMPELQIDLSRLLWTDGRVIAETDYEIDEQRFGTEDDIDGEQTPAGQEVIRFYGVLEGKVPLTIQNFSEFPFLSICTEDDVCNLKAQYPDVADQITAGASGAGDDQYERIARLSVMQGVELLTQSGDSLTHLATKARVYFRPSALATIENEEIKAQLLQTFPTGCKVVFAGNTFCEVFNKSMDKHVKVMHPLPGDGQDKPALGDIMISVQERLNDLLDIQFEGYDKGIPATWMDKKIIDIKALQEQQSLPANKFPCTNPNPGQPLDYSFHDEKPATVTPDMLKHIDDLKGPIAQFLTGAQPALFGGAMEDQKTASGYAMARDQAMGQMGVVWRRIKTFYAAIMQDAVMCAAQNRKKSIVVGTGTNTTEIELQDLRGADGNITFFPDTDENFPESWTQKSNKFFTLMQMAGGSPQLLQILTLPDNQYLFKQYIGLDDLKIPGADTRQKVLSAIQVLLKGGPVQPQAPMIPHPTLPGQMIPGPQPPPEPTVPFDPIYDDAAAEFAEVKTWINSEEGQTQKMTNPEGFMNVRLYGMERYKAIQAAQTPPQAKPPSESVNYKDVPPAAKIQMLAKDGIQIGEKDLAAQTLIDHAAKNVKLNGPPPPQVSVPPGSDTGAS